MVEIAPPAGWSATPALAGAVALAAAAASGSSVAFPSGESLAAVPAPAAKSPGLLTSRLHSTPFLWSASGAALLVVVGIAGSLVWHSKQEAPPQLATAYATLPAATTDVAQPAGENHESVPAKSGANEQVDLPTADVAEDPAKTSRPIDLTVASENVPAPATISGELGPAAEEIDSVETTPAAAAPAVLPRTLKLEPITGDATVTTAIASPAVVESSSASAPRFAAAKANGEPTVLNQGTAPAEEVALSHAPRAMLRFGPSSQDAAHHTNIADQVAVPIKSFDMADAPLSRVLETLANLAAVPITVDPSVLAAAGVSPDTKVTVHAQDTSLGKILGGVLRERKLACEVRDGQLTVLNSDNRPTSNP